MTALGQVLIVMSVLAGGIIYGTDVFSAIVLRPALALVDDRTLVAAMGRVHDFGDRRLRVPGVAGIGTAIAGTAVAAWAGHLGAAIAQDVEPVAGEQALAAAFQLVPAEEAVSDTMAESAALSPGRSSARIGR